MPATSSAPAAPVRGQAMERGLGLVAHALEIGAGHRGE
jgi:hypothetical protein